MTHNPSITVSSFPALPPAVLMSSACNSDEISMTNSASYTHRVDILVISVKPINRVANVQWKNLLSRCHTVVKVTKNFTRAAQQSVSSQSERF